MQKALLYWFALATAAALMGGGRVSLRLLTDATMMVAPLAIIQIATLAAVYATGRRTRSFATALDAFFAGSWPWIAAYAGLAAFVVAADPPDAWRWYFAVGAVLFAAAAARSIPIDYAFYRHTLGRSPDRAVIDLLAQRAIAWSATVFYTFRTTSPKIGNILAESAPFLTPWQ